MFRPVPSFVATVAATGLALGAGAAMATASSAAAPSTGGLAVSAAPTSAPAAATTTAPAAATTSGSAAATTGASAARAATSSPAVGPQKTWTGKTAPVDLPGTGIEQGDRLPKGSVLVYRQVDIPKGEKRRVRLVVPKGKKIETAAQSGSFGSGVINRDYVGTRSVTIRAAGGQKGAEGRLYAFAR